MSDIVERLLTTPTARTWDSVGRAYDYPEQLPKEAAAEIQRLRAEVERLRRTTVDTSVFLEQDDRRCREIEKARADAMERAAQIANKVARQFADDMMPREEDGADEAAAAIRAEASKGP